MDKQEKSPITMYGPLGGIATVVFILLVYILNPESVSSFTVILAEVGITVVFMVLAVIMHRRANGNYIEFKPALRTSYGTAAITWLIFCVFYFILYKFIDKDLINTYFRHITENIATTGKQRGMSDKEILDAIANVRNSGMRFDEPKTMFFSYLLLIILSFFYAMIISAIFTLASKDNKPTGIYSEQTEPGN